MPWEKMPWETLINWPRERIPALRSARHLAYLFDTSWRLRAVRLVVSSRTAIYSVLLLHRYLSGNP